MFNNPEVSPSHLLDNSLFEHCGLEDRTILPHFVPHSETNLFLKFQDVNLLIEQLGQNQVSCLKSTTQKFVCVRLKKTDVYFT